MKIKTKKIKIKPATKEFDKEAMSQRFESQKPVLEDILKRKSSEGIHELLTMRIGLL